MTMNVKERNFCLFLIKFFLAIVKYSLSYSVEMNDHRKILGAKMIWLFVLCNGCPDPLFPASSQHSRCLPPYLPSFRTEAILRMKTSQKPTQVPKKRTKRARTPQLISNLWNLDIRCRWLSSILLRRFPLKYANNTC